MALHYFAPVEVVLPHGMHFFVRTNTVPAAADVLPELTSNVPLAVSCAAAHWMCSLPLDPCCKRASGENCLWVCTEPLLLSMSLEAGPSPKALPSLNTEAEEFKPVQQASADEVAVQETPTPDAQEVVASQLSTADQEHLQAGHFSL